MADENRNVKRVFGNFATLDTGSGSIQKQFVYASDTQQIGVHLTDDTMDWVSSDDKQCLLAGTQTLTGLKKFSAGAQLNDDQILTIGEGGSPGRMYFDSTATESRLSVVDSTPNVIDTESVSGTVILANNHVNMLQTDQNGVTVPTDKFLNFGASRKTTMTSNNVNFTLDQSDGDINISSDSNLILTSGSSAELNGAVKFTVAIGGADTIKAESSLVTIYRQVQIDSIYSGATQLASSAVAGQLWKTASHATLPDNVVMIGV